MILFLPENEVLNMQKWMQPGCRLIRQKSSKVSVRDFRTAPQPSASAHDGALSPRSWWDPPCVRRETAFQCNETKHCPSPGRPVGWYPGGQVLLCKGNLEEDNEGKARKRPPTYNSGIARAGSNFWALGRGRDCKGGRMAWVRLKLGCPGRLTVQHWWLSWNQDRAPPELTS